MISLEKCRALLGKKGEHLTDQQIEQIAKELRRLARINIKIIQEQKNKKK
ncbi:MAG: hypothetical protein ACI8ZM_004174 [Crocinitomix sp.]|jgi:hypothetical protein